MATTTTKPKPKPKKRRGLKFLAAVFLVPFLWTLGLGLANTVVRVVNSLSIIYF